MGHSKPAIVMADRVRGKRYHLDQVFHQNLEKEAAATEE